MTSAAGRTATGSSGRGRMRKWNEIQNTPKDIQLLANYLLVQYKERVWNAAG